MTFVGSRLITLLTDFGTNDPFVGVMKGVILGRFPAAQIVDLTHAIAPQRVDQAAFWLDKCYPWFPPGTVHLAIVDPGVGTSRAALVAYAKQHVFVGPDNGLFTGILQSDSGARVHSIDTVKLGLSLSSQTFHGRDLFAPVAAEIACGRLSWDAVGPPYERPLKLDLPQPHCDSEKVCGRVVTIDRFGNLITDISRELLAQLSAAVVEVAGASCVFRGTYGDVAPGALVAVMGSFGTLEIACRDSNAQSLLRAEPGTVVVVRSGAEP
jgi:S-adenosylmethionine hydrolase